MVFFSLKINKEKVSRTVGVKTLLLAATFLVGDVTLPIQGWHE